MIVCAGVALRFGINFWWMDRKAVPTIAVARREDASAIEIEEVRIVLRLVGGTSPVEAIEARDPQRAIVNANSPATS